MPEDSATLVLLELLSIWCKGLVLLMIWGMVYRRHFAMKMSPPDALAKDPHCTSHC